jgi:serine/threonine-protein kinase
MKRIGRYEIQAELGRGAMGVVYRAWDPLIGRSVALKTIRLGELTSPEEREDLRERLFREARSAGVLDHKHIVRVYDIAQEGDMAWIVMELVEGRTLEQILSSEGILARERILPLLEDTASALDYAHQQGIIHRDIKPANIMVDAKGAKITDFGVAKIVSQEITRTNVVVGTPGYMSPEQIESKPLDGRSDQFALGVVAYELLTGEKPFAGDSLAALAFKIVRDDPVWPSRLNPTLPPSLDMVFRRALAKPSAARYGSCQVLVAALSDALAHSPSWQPQARGVSQDLPTSIEKVEQVAGRTVPPPPPMPRVRREPQPRRSWAWALLLPVVAAIASAAYFYWPQPRVVVAPPPPPVVEPQPIAAAPPPSAPVPVPVLLEPPKPRPAPAVAPKQAAAPREPELASAVVAIASTPLGAKATLAGTNESCTTPCSLELPTGRHMIRFEMPGHRTAVATVEVPGESTVTAHLDHRAGRVMVKSTPPGAQILVDGKLRPEVTPALLILPAGKHQILVRRPGVADEVQEIDVKDQAIANMEFSWAQ